MALRLITLSGTTEVTENLYIYEYGNDMLVVDCGVGFPEQEMYGVDLVIPDFTYIKENRNKLRAILVTHGHEDHIGAIPFLIQDVDVPIYSTKLVAGFIEEKLADYGIKGKRVNVFNPEQDTLSLGVYKIIPFRVSHSVPDAVCFAIDTPEGRVFHVPDYKFDWTPVDGRPFDIAKAAQLASGGTLCVASDCLGATTPGFTESEYAIEGKIEAIASKVGGKVFFTTISSNISRMQQALNVAVKLGRRVAFVGRSIESKAEIARNLGYLRYRGNAVVSKKQATKLPKDKVMYIISGCYGQAGSNLYRVALGEHDRISAEVGGVVIFSGDPAPPGTIRHMRAYKDLALRMGARAENVFEPMPGDIIEFKEGKGYKAGNVPVKNVLVDGLGIGDVGEVVLRDRHRLAQDGIAIVLLQIDRNKRTLFSDPEIISRGFVFHGEQKGFLGATAKKLKGELMSRKVDKRLAWNFTIDYLERYFYQKTGRRPMILPVIVEV